MIAQLTTGIPDRLISEKTAAEILGNLARHIAPTWPARRGSAASQDFATARWLQVFRGRGLP